MKRNIIQLNNNQPEHQKGKSQSVNNQQSAVHQNNANQLLGKVSTSKADIIKAHQIN